MHTFDRRKFLYGSALAGVGALIAGTGAATGSPIGTGSLGSGSLGSGSAGPGGGFPVRAGALADTGTLRAWSTYLASISPRYTGDRNHAAFIAELGTAMRHLGCQVETRTQRFTRWTAQRTALAAGSGATGLRPISNTFYFPYSGTTPPQGVTGELVYAGAGGPADFTGKSFTGKIAVVDVTWPNLPISAVSKPWFGYPSGVDSSTVFNRAALAPGFRDPQGTLASAKAAGAIGVIRILPMAPADAAGQYVPFDGVLRGLPAIDVDAAEGARLRTLAQGQGNSARLTLVATSTPNTPTDGLLAVLPGATPDVVVVNTHTDGPNLIEENGALGMLSIAQRLASVPQQQRPSTIAFYFATGHFAQSQLKRSDAYLSDYPDLAGRTKAGVTVEHLGAREYIDTTTDYRPSGLPEMAPVFCSTNAVATIANNALQQHGLTRSMPIHGPFMGEGKALDAAGIPMMSYITSPTHLLAAVPAAEQLRRFDVANMKTEIDAIDQMITTVASSPAAALRD